MSGAVKYYLNRLQQKPSFVKVNSFQWADYIELLCLANIDGEVTANDVIDRLAERERDLFESNEEDLEDLNFFEEFEDEELISRRAEIPDRWKNDLSDWFKVLQVRQASYKESYPFIVSGDEIKKKDSVTGCQMLYIYLILCSNLYLFDKSTISKLTSSFEIVCYNAFREILPHSAISHVFGSNPLNKTGRYNNSLSLWQRINLLCADINEVLNPHISETNYPKKNKGDGGLDLVGWIPTGDSLPSTHIFLGQCACTENWVSKQHASSYSEWKARIIFTNQTSNTIFIPFCFRTASGLWHNAGDIKNTFLVDRKRLLFYYLQSKSDVFAGLSVSKFVEEIINASEGIF